MIVLGRPVTVTAQTGPKIGAANQATGNDNQQHVNGHIISYVSPNRFIIACIHNNVLYINYCSVLSYIYSGFGL